MMTTMYSHGHQKTRSVCTIQTASWINCFFIFLWRRLFFVLPPLAPSPTPIRTESVDSPVTISTVGKEKDPFQNNEDDDEEDEEEAGDDEDAEEYNTFLPDKTELDYQFVGSLDGINIADGFENLFNVVKRKKVDIKDTDQAL